ncbi:MAG: hypothetical protein K6F53_08880 [Lachnospiraceae bacterium]|nr:hypothetical protein [Lachnospiraceae bacterium]
MRKKTILRILSFVLTGILGFGLVLDTFSGVTAHAGVRSNADDVGIAGGQHFEDFFVSGDDVHVNPSNRSRFKIIEVIPHPICSVFPLLVNWGSKESYDEHVPVIGYEGERYFAVTNGTNISKYGISINMNNPRKYTELDDYSAPMDQNYQWGWGSGVGYWREFNNSSEGPSAGYFEFVGQGKGLYKINLNSRTDSKNPGSGQRGIMYNLQCLNRDGSESPKGNLEVNNPLYYIKNGASANGAVTNFSQATANNYELKFLPVTSGTSSYGEKYKVQKIEHSGTDFKYDYKAYLTGSAAEWTYGFAYSPNGNYSLPEASKIVEEVYFETSAATYRGGDYYILDKNGNYELYTNQKLSNSVSKIYRIKPEDFKKADGGKYMLKPAGVTGLINGTYTSPLADRIAFEYTAGQGNYDLTFLCYEDRTHTSSGYKGTAYKAEITKVISGGGKYRLASSANNANNLYKSASAGDYAQVVEKISFQGIDQNANGAQNGDAYSYDTAWIFHPYQDGDEEGVTQLRDVPTNLSNCRAGTDPTRIYVNNTQYRMKSRYCIFGFENNDWLKLLMLRSNGDDTASLAWQDYVGGSSAEEITARYASTLAEMNYQIDITQCLPEELTPEQVAEADLIYVCDEVGIYGFKDSPTLWNSIIDYRIRSDGDVYWNGRPISSYKLSSMQQLTNMGFLKNNRQFRADTVLAIYKHAVFRQDTALILTNRLDDYDALDNNNAKLMAMIECLDNNKDFAYFIDDPEYDVYKEGCPTDVEGLSVIHPDLSITVYKNNGSWGGGIYNWTKKKQYIHYQKEGLGNEITGTTTNTWLDDYFIRYIDVSPRYEDSAWGSDGNQYYNMIINSGGRNLFKEHKVNQQPMKAYDSTLTRDYYIGNANVQAGCTWYIPWDGWNFLAGNSFERTREIWTILHNKKPKSAEVAPELYIKDYDHYVRDDDEGSITRNYFFYVDAYAASAADFQVKYYVKWSPEGMNRSSVPDLSAIEVQNDARGTDAYTSAVTHAYAGGALDYKTEADGPDNTAQFPNVFLTNQSDPDSWNDSTTVKAYIMRAVDVNGGYDEVAIYFIIRPEFMLN